ncbi:MAG TPA: flagellar hook capping FlgD N-terminal domain-containing protein [Phycisphaerae bacterium]|nr:flagellar hook capping FlgD N-terminal domain-containing protein [Phycisphaerae bacterium]
MSTAASAVQGSTELKLNFMKLLVTQLQNQNPLEPMDNAEMTSQLAQISQLEQLEKANGTFAKILVAEEGRYAASLLGKQVTFVPDGESASVTGQVSGVGRVGEDLFLRVGDHAVAMSAIQAIAD